MSSMATLGLSDGEIVRVVGIGGGLFVGLVWIVLGLVGGILRARAMEESRRELAAYVAEGTMSPEDAERLLKAGPRRGGCC